MKCPACATTNCTAGTIGSPKSEEHFGPNYYPDRLRLGLGRRHVALVKGNKFSACLNCGCVWASVNPKELTQLIKKYRLKPSELTLTERWNKFPPLKKTLITALIVAVMMTIAFFSISFNGKP